MKKKTIERWVTDEYKGGVTFALDAQFMLCYRSLLASIHVGFLPTCFFLMTILL